jgi:hypothetical protein
MIKKLLIVATCFALTACYNSVGMSIETAGKVQTACAELKLVSTVERGNGNTIRAVRCSTADQASSVSQ